MSIVRVDGVVSRIALSPFGSPTSYIRIDGKTYEFSEFSTLRTVLAVTQVNDEVALTFDDRDYTLILQHIHNRTLNESAGELD